jgi:lipopolysaccharide transport system permease protein
MSRAGPHTAVRAGRAATPRGAARVRDLLLSLSQSDLRARYGRGRWRLVKWLADPFAAVGVYLLLVTVVLERPGRAPGLSLACAVVPFQLLTMVVINALDAVRIRRSIVANMAFPRVFLPIASTLTESLAFGASLGLLAAMMAAYGVAPTPAVLWLPVVIAATLALAVAVAYPATLLGIWLPDARPFLVSLVRALFFLAPGLVALDQVTGAANDLIRINPLSGLFEAYRSVLVDGTAPAPWELGIPLAWAAVLAAVFVPVYRSEQRQFAKVVE